MKRRKQITILSFRPFNVRGWELCDDKPFPDKDLWGFCWANRKDGITRTMNMYVPIAKARKAQQSEKAFADLFEEMFDCWPEKSHLRRKAQEVLSE